MMINALVFCMKVMMMDFDPLSMMIPKGRKRRAKKSLERECYNDRRPQAHVQLCFIMCFTNV
jgi:hypothetical protein